MRLLLASFVVVVLGLPHLARAQSNPSGIVTDRPDFTESSEVIRRGGIQFESGATLETDGSGDDRSRAFTIPSALMRIGVGHRAEMRVGADGWVVTDVAGQRTSGRSDLEIGAKIRLFDQDRIGIDLAVLPIVSMPVGTDGFSSGGFDPTIKILWARGLPAGFDASGNVNVSALSVGDERFEQTAVSLSVGHDLGARWSAYLEVFGFSGLDRDGGRAITLNWGASRQVGTRMQFDVEAGRGMTAAAPDWFIGAGFAIAGSLSR